MSKTVTLDPPPPRAGGGGRRHAPPAGLLADRGLPPDGAAVSAGEYLDLAGATNLPVEWVDGRLEYLPMPSRTHQNVVFHFAAELKAFLRSSGFDPEVLVAPFPVLVNGRRREPDVAALLDAADARGGERLWTGADLLAEVVSPDDPDRDYVEKRADYAGAGVPEYWIVDPRAGVRRVTVLTLDGAAYRERGAFAEGAAATSALLPGFAADVSALLDAR